MSRDNRWWRVAFGTIFLLALTLRLLHLSRWSLNNDELVQVTWASGDFAEMMRTIKLDAVHPPLDYFVQFVVARLGGPEWIHRLPAVLWGTATVAMITLLGSWWISPAAGLVAGALMTIAPTHIRYSQEIRPYSLALFLITGSLVALELYARTSHRRWAIVWAIGVFLTGATLYFAGLIVALASFHRIWIDRRDRLQPIWRRLPAIVILWTLLYAPWFPVMVHLGKSEVVAAPEVISWKWLRYRLDTFGAGDENDWGLITAGSYAFWIAVIAGAMASIRSRLPRVALSWLLVGSVLQFLLLQIHPHYSAPRYVISSWPAAFLLAGAGIVFSWRFLFLRPVAVTLLTLYLAYAGMRIRFYYNGDRAQWLRIATYVHSRVKPGEMVMTTNSMVQRNFGHYWQRLPTHAAVSIRQFAKQEQPLSGPVWFVLARCYPHANLRAAGLMQRFGTTERAEVRYLRRGHSVAMNEELCAD